jgi:hypothetical protein
MIFQEQIRQASDGGLHLGVIIEWTKVIALALLLPWTRLSSEASQLNILSEHVSIFHGSRSGP